MIDDEIAAVDRDTGRAYVPAEALGRVADVLEWHEARIRALERPLWVRVWRWLRGWAAPFI